MEAFTLRLDPKLTKKLNQYCKTHGYKKNGFVSRLIQNHLESESSNAPLPLSKTLPSREKFKNLVGIIKLGGNAVQDAEDYTS